MPTVRKLNQIIVATLFVLALSFLTFAASFAEVPMSAYQPTITAED